MGPSTRSFPDPPMKLEDETIGDRHEKDPLIVISEEACKSQRRTFKTRPLADDSATETDLVEERGEEQSVSLVTTESGNILQYSETDEEHLDSHLIGRFDVRRTNQGPVCLLLDQEAMVKSVIQRDKNFSPENKKDKRTSTFSCWILKNPLAVDTIEAGDLQDIRRQPQDFTVSAWSAHEILVTDKLSHEHIAKCVLGEHVLEWTVGANVDVGFIAQVQFALYILHHPSQVNELVALSESAEWKLVGTVKAGVAYGEVAMAGYSGMKTAGTAVRHSQASHKGKGKGNPLKRLKPALGLVHHGNKARKLAEKAHL